MLSRDVSNDRADDLSEADVPLHETMVQKVTCLHDEERDVSVGRSEHGAAYADERSHESERLPQVRPYKSRITLARD
jgi:hypothetical protein